MAGWRAVDGETTVSFGMALDEGFLFVRFHGNRDSCGLYGCLRNDNN